MTTNNNRHCFVNFTGRPYIQRHGVQYEYPTNFKQYNNPERTIIRTNQPLENSNRVVAFIPDKGMANIDYHKNNMVHENITY